VHVAGREGGKHNSPAPITSASQAGVGGAWMAIGGVEPRHEGIRLMGGAACSIALQCTNVPVVQIFSS
jgi:hypothetical protein